MELHPESMAHGGEAVARHDGKAHFVSGALPGEVVEVAVIDDRGSWARARVVQILEPSPQRRTAPCPHAETCGGCQWQFADESAQRSWKRDIVESQLSHLGRLESPLVHDTVSSGPSFNYRNRMDFHVTDGRPSLMQSRSNTPVPLDVCLLLDPALEELFSRLGDLRGTDRLTLRTGIRTGDTIAIVEGEVPSHAESWQVPVLVRRGRRLEAVHGSPALAEIVAGVRFTIPFDGFFQNNTHGADALVELVTNAAAIEPHETMLDAYCGVGLFGATVGKGADLVIGLDSSTAAVDHARRNLDAVGVAHQLIDGSVTSDIERLEAYWDIAVVDPPRKGLGEAGVAAVTSAMPRRIVYVSCDPASLARDAKLLGSEGFHFVEATPVDLFPQTYHVEVVATFDRSPLGEGWTT